MARKHVAPLEAAVEIDASPVAVWDVLYDQRRMNEWSPETYKQAFIGSPLKAGTLSLNLNKRKAAVWPTLSRYREVVPARRLAFHVYGPAAVWSYDLEPTESGGTRVVERRRLVNDRAAIASVVTATLMLGGAESHDREILEGMHTTLQRLKAEVESR